MPRRMMKRSLLSMATAKPKRIYQTLHRDEFGELAERKRDAGKQARENNHQLGAWHRRPNDEYGRVNAFCTDCNRSVVVCPGEAPDKMPAIYGSALKERCGHRSTVGRGD